MTELRIADGLELPLDWMTMATVVYGARGSGKTTLGVVAAEELHAQGQRFCAVDLKGDFWGLKASADGRSTGVPVVIFGGEHADLPLVDGSGGVVGQLVTELPHSVIVDLEQFSKGRQVRWLKDFFLALYHHNRDPLLVIADEIQRYAPQRPMSPDETLCLAAVEDVVKLGRKHGLGILGLTQRGAGLNKEVSELCDVLVALRTPGPIDQERIKDWLDANATREQRDTVMGLLAKLPTGTGVVASGHPDLQVFKIVPIRRRTTYDSSATPKVGQRREAPRQLATVDLEVLKQRMAATIERAAADDPKALRARVGVLEQQLGQANRQLRAKLPAAAPTVERVVERVEVPVVTDEQIARLVEATDAARSVAMRLIDAADGIKAALVEARPLPQATAVPVDRAYETTKAAAPARSVNRSVTSDAARNNTTSAEVLSKGARGLLEELARRHPMRVTRTQLATLAGRGAKSSSYDQQLAELRRRGLVDHTGGEFSITAAGLELAGAELARPRTSDEVIETWRRALPDGARRLFDVLVALRGQTIDRAELATQAGMSPTSSSTDQHLSTLRRNGLADGHMGAWRASRTLFLEPVGRD